MIDSQVNLKVKMPSFYKDDDNWVFFPREIKELFEDDNNWECVEDRCHGGKGCPYKLAFEKGNEKLEVWCTTGTVTTTVSHGKWRAKRHELEFYNTDWDGLEKKAERGVRAHVGWEIHHHRQE